MFPQSLRTVGSWLNSPIRYMHFVGVYRLKPLATWSLRKDSGLSLGMVDGKLIGKVVVPFPRIRRQDTQETLQKSQASHFL